MKKTYRLFLAMLLMMVGAMNVSAEEISLEEVPFWQHEDGLWGLNAPKNTEIARGAEGCAWVIGEPTGQPYGDGSVNNFADLSVYTKLVITFTEGTPRVLMNRDANDGQWDADEANSHLIDNTKGGWSAKYFITEGSTMTVDLKQMVKDKGFAHLHGIKGANWANVTIQSMVVVKEGKAKQIGWVNLINNSNMEGDDVSSFFVKEAPASSPSEAVITDGIGKDGSRGIMVTSQDMVSHDYDTQFWFRFNEAVPAGTKYKVTFDYKADKTGDVGTQAHAEPSDFIHHVLFGNINFSSDWNTFTKEGEVTADQSKEDKQFLSVAFNLNVLAEANQYYFDNIKFEIFKYGTSAEFSNDVILLDFGFETNIPELVKKSGQTRLFYSNDCATVKVNGEAVAIASIEALKDGRLYVFLENAVNETDEVQVIFKNPAENQILYASGPNIGEAVPDVDEIADHNPDIEDNGGYPFIFVTPTVKSADPENGSFNLPVDLKEFKVTFDKKTDCEKIEAYIDGQKLSVSPSTGTAESFTFTTDATMAAGMHTMHITKIYPEQMLSEEVFGDTVYVFSTGPSDPTDVPYDVVSPDYFNNCSANSIPEGFIVSFGGNIREPGSTQTSGSRMFAFDASGDFSKGLYYREGYVQYGTVEGYALALEAGKKYNVHFNTAMWKSSGDKTRFEIMNANEEVLFVQVVNNAPDVNGGTGAVSGSKVYDIVFAPETSGNYILRWTSSGSETGNPEYKENLLANVKVSYIPSAPGGSEMAAIGEALNTAKTLQENLSGERYNGPAFDALSAAITKVDAERFTYTSPSACNTAIELLKKACDAMSSHAKLCNDYDALIKKAIDVVRQNKETKFNQLLSYLDITYLVQKYEGSSEWVDEDDDPETDPVLHYSFKVLKDDTELQTAIDELSGIVDETSHVFTQGAYAMDGNAVHSGVKVLVERLRLGAEVLKKLGRTDDDAAVTTALNALTDDDETAEMVKNNIKEIVYGQLKDPNNELFKEIVIDEEFGETAKPTYDMTAFVKNPNIYQLGTQGYSEEYTPGWIVPEGYNQPGTTTGWTNAPSDKWATDAAFQTWGSSYRVEQTVIDLPAGVYTVNFAFGERDSSEELAASSFCYVKNSQTEEGTDGTTVEAKSVGQAFPRNYSGFGILSIENVVVTDGFLTFGVNAADGSHTFFNDVQLLLTGPAEGFNYVMAYESVITGVDPAKNTAKVTSVQLFDLNGRQVPVAKKGIVIVKKTMSDGSVKVEKVIR